MDRVFIKNGHVVKDSRIERTTLVIEAGRIADDHYGGEIPHGSAVIDAEGMYVTPGFVELHAHGGGGYDFMDASDEAMRGVLATHLAHGTTSIMPTTVACDYAAMQRLFSLYRRQQSNDLGVTLLGVHLEGPYISDAMRGAQNPAYVRAPSRREVDALMSDAGDIIRLCTAAPELEGIEYMARRMQEKNILLSVGHSDGTYADIEKAYAMGFKHITHLYSNTPTVRKIREVVCAGVREAAYLIDGMHIELIADGHHVPKEVLQLAVKYKGVDAINLTTDAMRAAGSDAAESFLGEIKAENRVIIEDGVAKLPDRSYFAGSIATGDAALRWAVNTCGISLPNALRMLCGTPSRLAGAEGRKGSLQAGKDADLLLLDSELQIDTVITGGVIRHRRTK